MRTIYFKIQQTFRLFWTVKTHKQSSQKYTNMLSVWTKQAAVDDSSRVCTSRQFFEGNLIKLLYVHHYIATREVYTLHWFSVGFCSQIPDSDSNSTWFSLASVSRKESRERWKQYISSICYCGVSVLSEVFLNYDSYLDGRCTEYSKCCIWCF